MSYETIEVPADTHEEISVGTGETFSNRLINVTEPGASATITADGTSWQIRHIGVVGQNSTDGALFNVSDRAGSDSVMENIWATSGGLGRAIHVDRRHSGHLTIARARIRGFGDRGIVSHEPMSRGGGTVSYDRCYVAGCYLANIQTGTDHLERVTTDPSDGTYPGRGLWARGDTTVVDSNLGGSDAQYTIHAGTAGKQVTVTVEDSDYADTYDGGIHTDNDSTVDLTNTGTSPELSVPTGVPLSEPDAYDGTESTVADPATGLDERDFDIIEVAPGEHHVEVVRSEETLRNTVFDLSNNNTAATIVADGAGWAIENIVFDGVDDQPESQPCYGIVASVAPGASATIENVYMGDGSSIGPGDCDGNEGRGRAAMYVRADHSGDLTIRKVSIVDWLGGGIVSTPQANGNIHAETCYFRDCGYESLTLPTAGSTAEDCVFINRRMVTQ